MKIHKLGNSGPICIKNNILKKIFFRIFGYCTGPEVTCNKCLELLI